MHSDPSVYCTLVSCLRDKNNVLGTWYNYLLNELKIDLSILRLQFSNFNMYIHDQDPK